MDADTRTAARAIQGAPGTVPGDRLHLRAGGAQENEMFRAALPRPNHSPGPRRWRRVLAAVLAVGVLSGALVAPAGAESAPVGSSYTNSEWRDLVGAARYLGVEPEYVQRFGVATYHFLMGIQGLHGKQGEVLYHRIDTEGENSAVSWYHDEEVAWLREVMRYHTITPAQAQKLGATLLVFLAGVDAARRGVDIEALKPGEALPRTEPFQIPGTWMYHSFINDGHASFYYFYETEPPGLCGTVLGLMAQTGWEVTSVNCAGLVLMGIRNNLGIKVNNDRENQMVVVTVYE